MAAGKPSKTRKIPMMWWGYVFIISGKCRLLKHPPRLCGSKLFFSHPVKRKQQLIKTKWHTVGDNEKRTVGHLFVFVQHCLTAWTNWPHKMAWQDFPNHHYHEQNHHDPFAQSLYLEFTTLRIWILSCLPEAESQNNWNLNIWDFCRAGGHRTQTKVN